MSLIYITGISGSGKSEVRTELIKRGYEAHGTDEDGLAAYYDNTTGEVDTGNVGDPNYRTPEWRANHSWKVKRSKIKELADGAKDRPVFLCGVVANDNEVWDLFGRVFALAVDEDTLRHRITNRTDNTFGKNPHEFALILDWQKTAQEDYRQLGAVIVDATQPVNEVVDAVVAGAES